MEVGYAKFVSFGYIYELIQGAGLQV